MTRDSLFGETVIWAGRVKEPSLPFTYRVMAVAGAVFALVTLCYAVAVRTALNVPVGGMVVFSAWCAALAMAAWRLPLVWRADVEYLVTDTHVIWRRGRLRRSIERSAISYALIRWSKRDPTVGDLVLVRAVPTGALRRTLHLTLVDVEAPDRLWAIIRGVTPSSALGHRDRDVAQRLDPGERVLWSAIPLASTWSVRRIAMAALGAFVCGAFVNATTRGVPSFSRLFRAHALPSGALALFLAGAVLAGLLLLAVAIGVGYAAVVRPARLARATRYFVTTDRVLIRRGDEELSLDRGRITYVIDAPSTGIAKTNAGAPRRDLHDVFLVLDGPKARALAPSGAFGEDHREGLRPVFCAILDAETVGTILGERTGWKRAA
jgi:hypothetical protein